MTKVFKGPTAAEADAKADAWIAAQRGLKNVHRHTYLFRVAFPKDDAPKNDGDWTVTLRYDQES
jgi:hypothetical protein